MKRLLFISLLLAFGLWPFFSGRQQTTSSGQVPVDTLLARGQFQEAVFELKDSLRIDSLAGNWEAFQRHSRNICSILDGRKDYAGMQRLIEHTLSVLQKNGQGESLLAARMWSWFAYSYNKQEQFAESLACYQAGIKIYEKTNPYVPQLGFAYKNAAQVYMRYSDNRQAIAYLEAALRSDTTGKEHVSIYAQMASAWFFLDSLPQARQAYKSALEAQTENPAYIESRLSIGAALALHDNDLDEAERLTRSALQLALKMSAAGSNCLRHYATLADIANRRGHKPGAEAIFQTAETFGKSFYTDRKSREMAILYLAWGEFREKQGLIDQALALYQKAVIHVFPGFNNPDISVNPAVSEAYIESQAMFALASKGAALLKKTILSTADRENAAQCFELSFAVAEKLRQTYGNDADKLTLSGENRAYQRLAARNLWQLWQGKKEPETLNRLFRLIEQTKAQALADAVRQQRALVLAGIPDSLLQREATLRHAAADAALSLKNNELEGPLPDSLRQALQDRAFRAERIYADYWAELEKTYPEFRQFRTDDLMPELPALFAALPDTAALLSWFDAGDRYLCLVAQRSGLTAFEVPHDSTLDQRLSSFLRRLSDKSAQENAPDAFFAEAWALGNALLPDGAVPPCKSLIIVPDGRLCYLPFEALLTAPYQGNYGDAPFLLRRYTVHYAWSAVLLAATQERRTPQNGFLHVAPFVEKARDGLAPLPDSRREEPPQAEIHRLTGPAATVEHFLLRANEYNVLQLSTHAHAGGTSQPGIEFYDRTLALPQIYAQRLPAALVALSACETGAGEYADGEGVLSLARAFAYAGAQSLLASQWAVNERSTAQLFTRFYEHLESGAPRAEALRQAKLDWLNGPEADARKAPWHWAAFTLSGADGPVDLPGKGWGAWWWWIALAAAALLVARNLFRAKPK